MKNTHSISPVGMDNILNKLNLYIFSLAQEMHLRLQFWSYKSKNLIRLYLYSIQLQRNLKLNSCQQI